MRADAESDTERSSGQIRFPWLLGIMIFMAGVALAYQVVPGARRLYFLVSDEGTESFNAAYGLGGLAGCLVFLGGILFLGCAIAAYGVSLMSQAWRKSKNA